MAVYRVLEPVFIQGAMRQPGEILDHLPDGLDVLPEPDALGTESGVHHPPVHATPNLERIDVEGAQGSNG